MTEKNSLPGRIVDEQNHGWMLQSGGVYQGYDPTKDWGHKMMSARSRSDIEREFGATRPVIQVSEAEAEELRAAFDAAGNLLVGSVVAALEQVYLQAAVRWDRSHALEMDPYEVGIEADAYAARTLTAGRPGSWESSVLLDIVACSDEVLTTQPGGPSRVHVEARDRIAAVLRAWTNSPGRYTEVPENLAHLVSTYADDTYEKDYFELSEKARREHSPRGLGYTTRDYGVSRGWRAITDDQIGTGVCYRLLYSTSVMFDADLVG